MNTIFCTKTDDELTEIRKSMPKYLNDMTEDQKAISHAVYVEQKKRFDANRADSYAVYNQEVEKGGYKVGDRVSIDSQSKYSGMPHPRYRGRTGIITATRGKAYVVAIMDGNMPKDLIIPPVHLRKVGTVKTPVKPAKKAAKTQVKTQ